VPVILLLAASEEEELLLTAGETPFNQFKFVARVFKK